MKTEIKVPVMGESVTEASISAILKEDGSAVAMDEEILELETDKVNQVLYAPADGVLSLSVGVEEVVQIGDIVGYIDTNGSTKKKAAPKAKQAEEPPAPKAPPPTVTTPAPAERKAAPPLKQPLGSARQTKGDFLSNLRTPPAATPGNSAPARSAPPPRAMPEPPEIAIDPNGERPENRKKLSRIRKVIASRLIDAQNTTAMLTTFNEVDMSGIINSRKQNKDMFEKRHGVKLGFMSFFIKAVVSALHATPGLNSYIDGEEIVEREYYDVGIAVSTERGLVVPVIRNCDQLSFSDVEKTVLYYALKGRSGKLSVAELQGGGFTITNGGIFGSLLSTPILNPPQSGILGMHTIQERPVAINGKVEIRPMMYIALSYDHRIVDGKEAVTFLVHIKKTLEDFSRFFLEL